MKGCATCKIIAKKKSANEELDGNITRMIQEMKDEYKMNKYRKQLDCSKMIFKY